MYVFQALIVFVLDLPVTGCCVLSLQSQISILEQTHSQRLLEVTACHRQELDLETERMRDSQQQAERALEAREKAHRQRVHCLEEQVWESYKNCMYCNSDIYITFNSKKPLMKWKWNENLTVLYFSGLHTERTVGAGDEEEASVYEADAEIGALKTVVVWEFSAWWPLFVTKHVCSLSKAYNQWNRACAKINGLMHNEMLHTHTYFTHTLDLKTHKITGLRENCWTTFAQIL